MKKYQKNLLRIGAILLSLILTGVVALLCLNGYVKGSVKDRILTPSALAEEDADFDCILVLGCLVRSDGSPSDMLSDRLTVGVSLYEQGAAEKLLMSGDHGREEYDEVKTMKQFAVKEGVPSEDVFMDHAGFSTYESLYRARDVFGAKRVVIVTQGYHLYRALYIAEALGLEAVGVAADLREYSGQTGRDLREVLARVKDLAQCVFLPEPTYLGDPISLKGSGDLTNDGTDFTATP